MQHAADILPANPVDPHEAPPLGAGRTLAVVRRHLRHGSLPQLAALCAVRRLGSVSLAAEALHMAPSTVSGHLRKLGDAVGLPLFRCDGRRMQPLPAAELLGDAADRVFGMLAAVEHSLADLRQPLGASGCAAAAPPTPALRPEHDGPPVRPH